MRMLEEARGGNKEKSYKMLIVRSDLLEVSFEHIVDKDPALLRGDLLLQFKHEEATGPGVLREWFFLSLYLQDLDKMLDGSGTAISVDDWKAHTNYNYTKKMIIKYLCFGR
uniref:E3 ubiquitin-protein ligase UPL5 n=1 Tax=Solanum tuberosum TaxID=4113 RepID=M1DGG0_SOLTU